MPVPELDPEQRRAAREKAQQARRVRAELKQMLKAGEVTLGQVLDRAESTEVVGRMRVADLIGAMPSYGKVRTRELMDELEIASNRRVQGLGSRQQKALRAHFGDS